MKKQKDKAKQEQRFNEFQSLMDGMQKMIDPDGELLKKAQQEEKKRKKMLEMSSDGQSSSKSS
jgi:hypothetical protein